MTTTTTTDDRASRFVRADAPPLETARLVLRPARPDDAAAYFRWRSDPALTRPLPREPDRALADTEAALARAFADREAGVACLWTIVLRSDERAVVGTACIFRIDWANASGEIGYMLAREASGQGLAAEAVARVVAHGHDDLHLHRIEALVDPDNLRSLRLAEKTGFIRDGVLRGSCRFEGAFRDTVVLSHLRGP